MAQKLQLQLKEVGSKLETPPSTKDSLVKLLKVKRSGQKEWLNQVGRGIRCSGNCLVAEKAEGKKVTNLTLMLSGVLKRSVFLVEVGAGPVDSPADCLELALQFGMIMMFACAFPLAFAFATLNNITEIRTDALKLLAMLKRPVPRAATTIGAWLNIFQGKWSIEPGLAIILVIEHILLLIKFGFSRFVPESQSCEKCHTGTGCVLKTALENHFWWQKDVWRGKRE
ncbi:anoctamin-like protein [Quercus suber]|uniref:Anoctamin-like protein n=1 Tax=Quercus suber TaxID=58331 RepID=A0AAW0M911_QUESU